MFDWPQVVLVLGLVSAGVAVYAVRLRHRVVTTYETVVKAQADAGRAINDVVALESRVKKVEAALRIDTPMKPSLPAMMR